MLTQRTTPIPVSKLIVPYSVCVLLFVKRMTSVVIPTVKTTTETTIQTTLLLDTNIDVPMTSPSQNATNDTLQTSSTPVDHTTSPQHPSSPNIPVILATVSACNVSVLVVAIIVTIAICRYSLWTYLNRFPQTDAVLAILLSYPYKQQQHC